MAFLYCLVIILTLFSQSVFPAAAQSLTPSQSISDGESLISQGGYFKLGFFSPSTTSNNRYLGIWYNRLSVQTVVWVANRESPVYDTSGVLKVGATGNIVIVNRTETVIWSSNTSNAVENPILEFLQSGNLVVRDVRNVDSMSYVWQSFDYPGDTLLPGMKLGWNLKTRMNRYLSTWKNSDDPSYGDYTYGATLTAYLETEMYNGSNKYYRSGSWNGIRFSGASDLRTNTIFTYDFINNAEEMYYVYQLLNQSVVLRFVLTQTSTEGRLQRFTWSDNINNWVLLVSIPRDRCDNYALCGPYSTCDVTNVAVCRCLERFEPKSPQDWSGTDWSMGCQRKTLLNCSEGSGFVKYVGVKLPDTTGSLVDVDMNLAECRVKCLNNCSCMAYTNSDIRGGGSGCLMWFTDLMDIKQLNEEGQELYIRMAASELGLDCYVIIYFYPPCFASFDILQKENICN
ncbi:hypothetical protein ACHQM5_024441 [Ranunculus cassubicifolius]